MKEQVGALGHEMDALVLERGDDGFHRLFAKFLGAMLRPLVQQSAGIGRLSARRRAGIDGGGQIVDRETRHQLNSRARPQGRTSLIARDLALLSPGVVMDRAASAVRHAPYGPWLHVW